ncbi:MAG: hypothetical protein GC204_16340 [Chloroflexi bacterium]|nr:hypothetical protein [Chloroflexota bacterium]
MLSRKHKRWIVSIVFIMLLLAAYGGITIWIDPPISYYGHWIRQHELRERQITPVTCVQLHITGWYRLVAQVFPAPSSFICFDTDAEARRWMLINNR